MAQRVSQYFGSTLNNATTGVNTATNLAVGFSTSAVAAAETPFQVSGNASISGSLKVGTAVTINQTSGTISAVLFDGAFSGIITSAVNLVGGIATASSLLVTGITSVSNSGVNIGNVYTVGIGTTVVTGTATTAINYLGITTFRSVKYQIQIAQNQNFQATDLLVIHNGTTANLIEYGSIATGEYLGVFEASISGGNLNLNYTPNVSAAATISVAYHAMRII